MMESDNANPFSNDKIGMHLARKVLTDIHHAAKSVLQAKKKVKKNPAVQIIIRIVMARVVIPNKVDLLTEKIRRKKSTKLILTVPSWRTCNI